MKNSILGCALFFFLAVSAVSAQQGVTIANSESAPYLREGKFTFDVSYPGAQPADAASATVPVSRIVYLKNNMMRVDTKSKTGTATVLIDLKNKIASTLTEVMGKKYAVKTTAADVQNELNNIPHLQVQGVDDFKFTGGYYCQKYLYSITYNNMQPMSSELFVNNKVVVDEPNWYIPDFREVHGFMFEYTAFENGIAVKYSVSKIEPVKETDTFFKIPAGYQAVTKVEIATLH